MFDRERPPLLLCFLVGDGERRRWVGDGERFDWMRLLIGDGERFLVGEVERFVGDGERRLVGDGERFDVRVDCCIGGGCC